MESVQGCTKYQLVNSCYANARNSPCLYVRKHLGTNTVNTTVSVSYAVPYGTFTCQNLAPSVVVLGIIKTRERIRYLLKRP